MSNVPASRRRQHDFVTTHKLYNMRKTITELAINDFGYDQEKFEKKIDKYAAYMQNQPNGEELIAKMREKNKSYYKDFVEEETKVTRDIYRKIVYEFEIGNNIFPSGDALHQEYLERRLHFDRAIGWLHCLKQEMQYIGETLTNDKNHYEGITKEIDEIIRLVRGVRRSANKFLKKKGNF